MAVPLHQERSLGLVRWDGSRWTEPKEKLKEFYLYRLYPNLENPQIIFDGKGVLTMVFRHWTRYEARKIGSRIGWENYLTRFDGQTWTRPTALPNSRGSIEKRPALATGKQGVWAAWMTDNRTFDKMIPQNADIYAANLGSSLSTPSYDASSLQAFADPFAEEVPIHADETGDIETIRRYTIRSGSRNYKIYRGDLHRHTDVSQDFKYDGSLIEVYRYGLDAAAYGLIIGGALGNVADRMRFAAVTDFLDVYIGSWHWPAFNLADVAVVCGVGLILLSEFLGSRKSGRRESSADLG